MTPRHHPTLTISLAVVMVVLVVGSVWSLVTPPLAVVDEEAHLLYAVSLVHGQLRGTETVVTPEDFGQNRTITSVRVPQGYADSFATASCHVFKPGNSAGCAPPLPTTRGPLVAVGTTAGTYPPLWYALIGLPTRWLPPSQGIYAARLVNVLVSALALGGAAAGLARRRGPGWRWVGLAVAITPMAGQLFGGVNPNGAEIAFAILTHVALMELLTLDVTRWSASRFAVGAVGLVVMRPLSILWLGVAVVVAGLAWGSVERVRALAADRTVRLACTAVVVSAVGTIAWLVWRDTLGAFQGIPDPRGTGWSAIGVSLSRTMVRTEQLVGRLGYLDVLLPGWLLGVWYASGLGALVAGGWRTDRRIKGALALVVLLVVLVPVVAEWRTASDIGFAWQGRYSLAMAVGAPLIAGVALDARRTSRIWIGASVAAALLAGHLAAIVVALRRYEVGVLLPYRAVFDDGPSWEPPRVPDEWLIAGAAAALVVVWVVIVRCSRGGRTPAIPSST